MDTTIKEPFEEEINIIVRQTSYSREKSLELLKLHGTVEDVIKDYLGITKKVEQPVSTNQGIFKSIRNFL
jgi:hypothetical protein